MRYRCLDCGYVYDEAFGSSDMVVAPNTRWEWLPDYWLCNKCGASKARFKPQLAAANEEMRTEALKLTDIAVDIAIEDVKQNKNLYPMSQNELSILCSNLSKSCKRQYLFNEGSQFEVLAEYFESKTLPPIDTSVNSLLQMMQEDLSVFFLRADSAAEKFNDRGAKRILKWTQRVTRISNFILSQFISQGDSYLLNKKIYICEICGFLHIGDEMPHHCPVCHVSDVRISQVI